MQGAWVDELFRKANKTDNFSSNKVRIKLALYIQKFSWIKSFFEGQDYAKTRWMFAAAEEPKRQLSFSLRLTRDKRDFLFSTQSWFSVELRRRKNRMVYYGKNCFILFVNPISCRGGASNAPLKGNLQFLTLWAKKKLTFPNSL